MVLTNNQKFNNIIKSIDINNKPNLFLHVCCAPCFSGIIAKLSKYFNLFIIFYNSNIDTSIEYNLRLNELKKLLKEYNNCFQIIYAKYNHDEFLNYVTGFENEPEGGKRCAKCFELRLKQSYDIAIEYIKNNNLINQKNYLCTTLSISPHKNADLIKEIGENICSENNISYLPSDFKKEDGYLNSIKISKELDLYRQIYCGCEFSK